MEWKTPHRGWKRTCACAGFVAVSLVPQMGAQQTGDPAAVLTAAAAAARIEVEGTPAFRAEANFKIFDYRGALVSSGTVTEEFLKPGYRKLSVHEGSTEAYAPEDQEKIGDPAPAAGGTFMQRLLLDAFLHPGPSPRNMAGAGFKQKEQKLGNVALRCVTVTPAPPAEKKIKPTSETYCLAADKPIIRLASVQYGFQVVYNRFANFAGHTVAQQISIQQRGVVRATLEVTHLASDPKLQAADFTKTEEERDTPERNAVKIGAAVQVGQILVKVPPVYPLEAKQKHISGTVFLHAIIGKDGLIEGLEVISAPDESLAEAAMDAVNQWQYRPYLLNGKPTEVDTTITVNFSFG